MLMRYDPFREMEQTLRSFSGLRPIPMPMDAYRRGEDFHVLIDLPGVDADSIDVTVERNVLQVSARRSVELGQDEQWLVRERPTGEVTRQLFLGEGLDTDSIEASYDNGVLSIRMPVAASAKPHRIAISTGGGRSEAMAVTANSEQAGATTEEKVEANA